jgi:hypothetical protein
MAYNDLVIKLGPSGSRVEQSKSRTLLSRIPAIRSDIGISKGSNEIDLALRWTAASSLAVVIKQYLAKTISMVNAGGDLGPLSSILAHDVKQVASQQPYINFEV